MERQDGICGDFGHFHQILRRLLLIHFVGLYYRTGKILVSMNKRAFKITGASILLYILLWAYTKHGLYIHTFLVSTVEYQTPIFDFFSSQNIMNF